MDRQGFAIAQGEFKHRFGKLNRDALRPIPFKMDDLPQGWLSELEAQILYNIGLISVDPIVELGSWIGRSTCAIAAGVRDNARKPIFDVYDLGIVGLDEFQEAFNVDPLKKQSAEDIQVLTSPGGVPGLLVQNLKDRGLRRQINQIYLGNFKNSGVSRIYSTGFMDACHFKWEIDLNVPDFMKSIDPKNFLIAFDDVWSLEACDYVTEMVGAEKAICLGGEAGDFKCKMSIMARGEYARLPWFC